MGRKGHLENEMKRLETGMKYALDMRDAADLEARRLEEAIEKGEYGQELDERVRAAREVLRMLEKERDVMDELIKRASTVLDKLRSTSALRRLAAFFGGFLIFIGGVAITSGAFMLFMGMMEGLIPMELEKALGIVAITIGALLVVSGFIHQVP